MELARWLETSAGASTISRPDEARLWEPKTEARDELTRG